MVLHGSFAKIYRSMTGDYNDLSPVGFVNSDSASMGWRDGDATGNNITTAEYLLESRSFLATMPRQGSSRDTGF